MPQVSIYLDQDVLESAKRNAQIERVSLSKYIARALSDKAASGWPAGYWDLFGALTDETFEVAQDVPFTQVGEDKVSFL